MSNRTLVHYEEERNPEGPYWTLEIQRSSAGQPGLLFTIRSEMFDRRLAKLDREMTIVVNDGSALLAPVLEWLERAS